ncbi:hypothetical protein Hanom_Chr06g00504851 [Helianthus anomalus]
MHQIESVQTPINQWMQSKVTINLIDWFASLESEIQKKRLELRDVYLQMWNF